MINNVQKLPNLVGLYPVILSMQQEVLRAHYCPVFSLMCMKNKLATFHATVARKSDLGDGSKPEFFREHVLVD
jgi:hypothetical protein